MRTKIRYSRLDKEYHVLDGDEILASFPRGEKPQAEVWQLRHEAPEIADVAGFLGRKYPQLMGRAFRGGQIVAGGGVESSIPANGFYRVQSQTNEGEFYKVYFPKRLCKCMDWDNGHAGHQYGAPVINGSPMCKHLCAVEITGILERQEQEGRPTTGEEKERGG
ncbi:MAG: hypothetical protein DRQ02_01330 [Candidatus Latescibacterota bacterium]|nr:MAG: hypothetical protein DRQ02_01330 [Candidatus Latescibacterota bacterium]